MVTTVLVIFWIILCIIISGFLKHLIVQDINSKPTVSLTVIDQSYADCLSLVFLYEILLSVSIILCLMSDSLTLSYQMSLAIAFLLQFALINCCSILAITGLMRLVTLISNSEQFGIQSFGPDYLAVWRIRMVSFGFVLCLMLYCVMVHNSIPLFFYELYHREHITRSEITKYDSYFFIYSLPIVVAFMINTIAKIYKVIKQKQLFEQTEEKFALSFENVIVFPLLIMLTGLFQFQDRYKCLVLLYPLVLTLSAVVFPLIIISRQKRFIKNIHDFCANKICLCLPRTNTISPHVWIVFLTNTPCSVNLYFCCTYLLDGCISYLNFLNFSFLTQPLTGQKTQWPKKLNILNVNVKCVS